MMILNVDLKIVHRDLRGENIFLYRETNGLRAKICNFGLSLHSLSSEDSRQFDIGKLNFLVKYFIIVFFFNESQFLFE